MFSVLTGARKRRTFGPATFAASLGAHLLLVGGALYAAAGGDAPEREAEPPIVFADIVDPPPPPPPPVEMAPAPPAPVTDDTRLPVPGERLDLRTPESVPEGIAEEPAHVRPVDPREYERDGRTGDVIGPRVPGLDEPTGRTGRPAVGEVVIDAEMAERRPVLERDGLSRALSRYYPPALRDTRLNGSVLVQLVVDEQGRVRPGTVEVIEASHPAFREAALRAVERFRFRPAQVGGTNVAVRVTIPIDWSVP
jgi:periplasmic protein TonB